MVKSLWSGLLVAFSMYSAVPVPQVEWDKRTMRWALSFLPLIGVLTGGAEWLWFRLCAHFGAAALFYAVIAALIPLVISGGIHLDGFTDTCDALCSFGGREKRLAIMGDPHVGAFGTMWLIALLLAEAACFAQVYETPGFLPLALTGFVFARIGGGRKVVAEVCAKDSGLAHIFAENSDKRAVSATLALELAAAAVLIVMWRQESAACLLLLALWYFAHKRLSEKNFGGITGDLAGFFISIAELLALFCAALGGLVL